MAAAAPTPVGNVPVLSPSNTATNAQVVLFHELESHTCSYVISCPTTKRAVILDSVLNYNHSTGVTSTKSADAIADFVRSAGLTIDYILESHVHADHLTAAPYLKTVFGSKIGIGNNITAVHAAIAPIFDLPDLDAHGAFDYLFNEGDTFKVGELTFRVLHTPGHTPACVTYVIDGDAVFVGDTVFMPDQGTARCDFPGGSATVLWNSLQKVLTLPPTTRLFTCHDYAPGGREYGFETTVGAELASNMHVKEGTTEEQFVTMRSTRDATLPLPALMIPSVQVNIMGGHIKAHENGIEYIKIPVNKAHLLKQMPLPN